MVTRHDRSIMRYERMNPMTYQELAKATENQQLPLSAINEHGENVVIEHRDYREQKHFKLTTAQRNGWCRINYIYEDGSLETTYLR